VYTDTRIHVGICGGRLYAETPGLWRSTPKNEEWKMVLKNEGSRLNRVGCIGCEEGKCTPAGDLSFRAFVFLHCVAVIAGVLNHLTTVARTKAKIENRKRC
jgi:hypothetical protein